MRDVYVIGFAVSQTPPPPPIPLKLGHQMTFSKQRDVLSFENLKSIQQNEKETSIAMSLLKGVPKILASQHFTRAFSHILRRAFGENI